MRIASADAPEAGLLPQARGFEVRLLTLPDDPQGHSSILLSQTHEAFRDIFTTLTTDVANHIAPTADHKRAVEQLLARLKRWQQFLERSGPEGLGDEAQRGLFGELWFISHFLLPARGVHAIMAWTGPAMTAQDFQLPGMAVEVKTTTAKEHQKLPITGEKQLDSSPQLNIFLFHLSLNAQRDTGVTLVELVAQVRGSLASSPLALAYFEDALLSAGYLDAHANRYLRPGYLKREHHFFKVTEISPGSLEVIAQVSEMFRIRSVWPRACHTWCLRQSLLAFLEAEYLTMELDQFAEEFRQEVLSQCDDEDSAHFREDKFTEVMIDYLKQANEVDDGEVCYHKHDSRGEKLNGFSVSGDGECLDLFVCSFNGTVPPQNIPNSEVKTHFKRLLRFFEAALDAPSRGFEDASPIFDVAQQIHVQREELTKARFFFLTDGVVKNAEIEDTTLGGIEIQHFIWDMEKLHRFVTSGMQREVIEINFADEFGGAVPCVGTADATDEYCTYLAFFPGALLAKLYGEYGPRLLEKNVRSFLQAKGKINKGIRDTILNEPHRFLAYNNGISATAEQIRVEHASKGIHLLKWARDFQIVNGGQTTASIYHAFKKNNADLSKLAIQVKLTVLNDPQKIDVFVPLISRYANSQNKVNAADFSANHPYHVTLEELSRTIWAPAASGTRAPDTLVLRAGKGFLPRRQRQAGHTCENQGL